MVVVALGMLLNLGFWVIAGFAVIGNLYNLAMLAACIRKFRKDEKEKKIRPRDSKEFHKKIGVE
jgi:amino acid transporter